jgi:hypothetical protein
VDRTVRGLCFEASARISLSSPGISHDSAELQTASSLRSTRKESLVGSSLLYEKDNTL